ncbi:MAG: SURF1 family protein [Nitrosomonadales bacterium]|nr:SURF1 family protein [Nitrosomonadales bacterium]MBT3918021.1 SURF1 family protein [Nitrosomonadales bacterium]MBT4182985.1 SURF1 family protein [Nitrosomonadales bacterium]MBT4570988.1 SURF1 family protein [Nitrosomonadales bacterium]MBT4760045.1 SURF1 family protein [Nitrosomonadales bacterium]
MFFNNYKLKFSLFPTLVFIITFCGFIILGFWQIDRADQKNDLNTNYADRQQDATIVLNKYNALDEKSSLLWRKVTFEGSLINNQNIILDNQIFNQIPGFNIITPFKIKGSDYVVLVNRGWHPNLKNREMLPNINEIVGKQSLQGHIADFPVSGIKLGKNNIETLNSKIFRFQRLDVSELNYFLSANVLPYMIYLDPIVDKELYGNFKLPAPDSQKNYGYAFQWFAFAITLLIIFIRLSMTRKSNG